MRCQLQSNRLWIIVEWEPILYTGNPESFSQAMGYSNGTMTSVSDAADGMFFECTKQLRAMSTDAQGVFRIADEKRLNSWKSSVSCFLTNVNRSIEIASFSEVFIFYISVAHDAA